MEFTITFLRLFFGVIYLLLPILGFLGFVIIVLGQIVCHIEKWNRFDAVYWAFITATTVGFGDIRPLRKASRVLSIFIALVGIMFTGIIVSVTLVTVNIAFDKHVAPHIVEELEEGIY